MTNSPESWLDDYGDLLYRYAFSRVRNKEDAEDLVQETLLAGMIAYEKFSGQSKISTWLVGILKHKILDIFRKNKREITILQNDETADDILAYQFDQTGNWQVDLVEWKTPDKAIDNTQFMQVFDQCITRLPQRMADLLWLRSIEQLEMNECQQLLGFASDNQLWVALSRTRVKLRQCLEVYWFEDKE